MKDNFKNFYKLWLAGLISAVGSGFTGYGLSIWVYMETGEVSKYSMVSVVTVLPGILIGFFAGVLVDFVNHKRTMFICDMISCFLSFVLLGLLYRERLELFHIYIILSIVSTLAAIRWSAYASSIVLTVDTEDLKRANGMDQFTNAASQIFPPIFAAMMVNSFLGVGSVILLDGVSYIISMILVCTSTLDYKPPKLKQIPLFKIFAEEFMIGIKFLCERKELLGLLANMALLNYISGGMSVLFSPMILAFAPKYALSLIMTVSGMGMIFGSLLVMVVKKLELNTYTIMKFSLLLSFATVIAGAVESVVVICLAGFVFFTSVAIGGSAFPYVFQRQVPAHLQGRVFAVRKTIITSTLPLSYLSLGFLADNVFIPFINKNKLVSSLFGQGDSRGIGLLLVTLGFLSIAVFLLFYYKPGIKKLRLLEEKMKQKLNAKNVLVCIGQIFLIIFIYKLSMEIIQFVATPIYRNIGWIGRDETLTVTSEFTISNVIAYAMGIFIALFGYCIIIKYKKSNILSYTSLNTVNPKGAAIAALFGFCVNVCVMYVMILGKSNETLGDIYAEYIKSAESGSVWIMLIFVGVLIPVFEEVIYRGLIFNLLRENVATFAAIVLQALLFVVFEMIVGGNGFIFLESIYGFIMAVVFALFYIWTKSLWSSIFARAFKNLAALIIVSFINEETFISGRYVIMTIAFIGIATTFIAMKREGKNKEYVFENKEPMKIKEEL